MLKMKYDKNGYVKMIKMNNISLLKIIYLIKYE